MTIVAHATNDEPCDICSKPVGASRADLNRHVICAPCASYVTSARANGGASAAAARAPQAANVAPLAAKTQPKLAGEAFAAAIADAMEDEAKRDPDAPTSVFNVNLGLSYTP